MKLRKPTIPDDALGGARNVRDAARAAVRSAPVRDSIDRLVRKAGFRRYRPMNAGWAFDAAVAATHAFFQSGSTKPSEQLISESVDPASEYAVFMDDIRRSHAFAVLRDTAADAVAARFPGAAWVDVVSRTASMLAEEIVEAVDAADDSVPLDAIGGAEVVVCYVPGLSEGADVSSTMTSFWTDESSSLTVRPDVAFMHLLSLANVSVQEWLDAVEKSTGERPDCPAGDGSWKDERAAVWSGAYAEVDPSRPPLVKPSRLVEAVDACYLGFSPLIAFNADAGSLCARNWETPIGVKGGVLGLHDFVNGSGDPLRFEQKVVVQARPCNMMVGEARACDFNEVHGFVRKSFRSKVTEEAPLAAVPSL